MKDLRHTSFRVPSREKMRLGSPTGSQSPFVALRDSVTIVVLLILVAFVGCGELKVSPDKPALPEDAERSRPRQIRVVETSEGFAFFEGEEEVLFYQRRPKSIDGKYSRCHYIHPLYGVDGEILTEDFPSDHLHHRGIFWAWHQVLVGDKKVGDGWSLEDVYWDVYDAQVVALDCGASALKVEVFWKSPLWTDDEGLRLSSAEHSRQKPFVKETAVVRVYPASGDIRKIDFEISLLALEDGVRIGGAKNKKAYGGFSARIRLPKDISFTGQGGAVTPAGTPIEAGPWLDFSGSFGEQADVSGLAILCHRSLAGYPRRWILRRSGSMQNVVYPGQEPVSLSREEPLVLRYRLIVHRGDAQEVDLNKLQAQYNAEPR